MKWLMLFMACSSLSFFSEERLNPQDGSSLAHSNSMYLQLNFEKDSSSIHPELNVNLFHLKDILTSESNYSLKLIGVALKSESPAGNLSIARSATIKKYLMDHGIQENRISILYNIVLNDDSMSEEFKDSNRRVKFDLYK